MRCKNEYLMIIIILICITTPLSAQMTYKGLIFSEVYLDKNQPEQSWLEIYNPTSATVILENFRVYHIKTTNMLPRDIIEKGGIEIPSKKCIVLCANNKFSNNSFSGELEFIEVPGIACFGKGGFFSMSTRDFGESGIDIIRYGAPEYTSELQNQLGDFVVPLSEDLKSYSRVKSQNNEKPFKPNFIKTMPSPCQYSEKEAENE